VGRYDFHRASQSALISCHDENMPGRASKDRDFMTVARRVVEHAIGEHLDGTPLEDPDAGKNPAALAVSKLGAIERRKGEGGKALSCKTLSHRQKSS
jgi:hypothetical protein